MKPNFRSIDQLVKISEFSRLLGLSREIEIATLTKFGTPLNQNFAKKFFGDIMDHQKEALQVILSLISGCFANWLKFQTLKDLVGSCSRDRNRNIN